MAWFGRTIFVIRILLQRLPYGGDLISPLARVVLLVVFSSLVPHANAQVLEPEFEISVDFTPSQPNLPDGAADHLVHYTIACMEWSPIMQKDSMVFTPYALVNEAPEGLYVETSRTKVSYVFEFDDCDGNVAVDDSFEVRTQMMDSMPGLVPVSLTIGLSADQGEGNGSVEWRTRTAFEGWIDIREPLIITEGEWPVIDSVRIDNNANAAIIGEVSINRSMDSIFNMHQVSFGPISHEDGVTDVPITLTTSAENRDKIGEFPLFLDVHIKAADPAGYHIDTKTVATEVTIRPGSGMDPEASGSGGSLAWVLFAGIVFIASRYRHRF